MKGKFSLYICGCRGSRSVFGAEYAKFGGQTTCFILKEADYALVIDCGTGLYSAREILADCTTIDVLVTHWHYDHISGLLDWSIFPEGVRPTFFVSSDAYNLSFDALSEMFRHPFWPVDPTMRVDRRPVRWDCPVCLRPGVDVTFRQAPHPDGASVIELMLYEKRVWFLCDFEHNKGFPEEMLTDCNFLIYDGMYTDEEYPSHINWGHSTWQEACRLANRVKPERMLITHHEPRRTDAQLIALEKEAKKAFPATVFARAGMVIDL